jgi:oxygen-independent coproporphyrinogen-3 oxidase
MTSHQTIRQNRHAALLRENRQVPRYTSYPTAPHFSAEVGGEVMANWLSALPDGSSLSLYVHIPFCRQMCWYCGCNTRASKRYAPVEAYLDTLSKEIELVATHLGGAGAVSHIHFGGGSPSLLTPGDFTRLLARLRETFSVEPDAEIAIELDPREVSEAKVAAYALAGVTRASLGVQDFHADVQTAINRMQPFHVIYDAVKLLRGYGIRDINMDLLYGLPNQMLSHIEENVDFASALAPTRISLFGYAHVPWMKKHMRLINEEALPDAAARLTQFDAASARLQKRGYVPVGLDHFVDPTDGMARALKDGTLQRNFQGYTTDSADALIGLGPSAISALPQGYAQNTPAARQYAEAIEAGQLATCKGKALSADDRLRRHIIETLMCYFTLDLTALCLATGTDITAFGSALDRVRELEQQGLAAFDGRTVSVPQEARQAVRLVAAAFDAYLTPSKSRHAQVA